MKSAYLFTPETHALASFSGTATVADLASEVGMYIYRLAEERGW